MLFSEAGMDWWDKLVAKLPSWRGVAYFWYVAAHWENISREFEEYRKRIRDREEWAQRALEGQQVLHQQEKQRLEGKLRDTLTREVAGRIVAEQEAAQYRAAFDGAIRSVVNSQRGDGLGDAAQRSTRRLPTRSAGVAPPGATGDRRACARNHPGHGAPGADPAAGPLGRAHWGVAR